MVGAGVGVDETLQGLGMLWPHVQDLQDKIRVPCDLARGSRRGVCMVEVLWRELLTSWPFCAHPLPPHAPLGTFVRAQTKLFRPSSTTLFTFTRKGSKQRVTATTLRSGMIGFQSSGISW